MTARLEILGEDGEWHEVPGIASVELHEEQPQPEELMTLQQFVEQTRPLRQAYVQAVHAYVEAARPVVEAAARGIEAYGRALRQAGVIDQHGRLVASRTGPPGNPRTDHSKGDADVRTRIRRLLAQLAYVANSGQSTMRPDVDQLVIAHRWTPRRIVVWRAHRAFLWLYASEANHLHLAEVIRNPSSADGTRRWRLHWRPTR